MVAEGEDESGPPDDVEDSKTLLHLNSRSLDISKIVLGSEQFLTSFRTAPSGRAILTVYSSAIPSVTRWARGYSKINSVPSIFCLMVPSAGTLYVSSLEIVSQPSQWIVKVLPGMIPASQDHESGGQVNSH